MRLSHGVPMLALIGLLLGSGVAPVATATAGSAPGGAGVAIAGASSSVLMDGGLGGVLRQGPWTLLVPPGAFRGKTQVTMYLRQGRTPTVSIEMADPSLNSFMRPVILHFRAASPSAAAGQAIYLWNESELRWDPVSGSVANTVTGGVLAPLQHFSTYTVGGKAGW